MDLRKKEFSYKGRSMEELQKLDVREFAKITTARARRTILRNFNTIEEFINRSRKKIAKNKMIKTHNRDLVVVPQLVGMKIGIYNGKEFFPVEIMQEMLGQRFGEFSNSRVRTKHGNAGVGATKGSKSLSKK